MAAEIKVVKITKGFSRKITVDFASVEVATEITADVAITTPEDLIEAGDKLARQVRVLSTRDYKEWKKAKAEGKVE